MHRPHWMQPRFGPLRMSTPVGQTCDALQAVDAVAGRQALARSAALFFTEPRGSPRS